MPGKDYTNHGLNRGHEWNRSGSHTVMTILCIAEFQQPALWDQPV